MPKSFLEAIQGGRKPRVPDVLACLANLSNDEVFTPPAVANSMLDLLPQELFRDPAATFLDPACKTGVFLREIAKRLIAGLEDAIPDLQERVDHILHEQLFGIAITELTSLLSRRTLYCSTYPNGRYSVSRFESPEGNVRYRIIPHTWEGNRCKFCGASRKEWERAGQKERHAYEFIHAASPERIFDMKFDVIISNPPYQMDDGGNGKSSRPIYQLFVEQAKKMNPRYLCMIVPARWYAGGKGLDGFRKAMLSDRRMRALVDYENFRDVFPGVDLAGGACYFLWDREYSGECEVTNFNSESPPLKRNLGEYGVFIRQNGAVGIVKKVVGQSERFLSERVFPRKPFGLPTNYAPTERGVPCWYIQKIGKKFADPRDITDQFDLLDKWKFLIPATPIAGQTDFSGPVGFYYEGNTRIAGPGEACSESWIVAGAFESWEEAESYKSYIFTKTVRFLLLQAVVSQHVTRKNFCFVPDLGKYDRQYTDGLLRELWGITGPEWDLISSKIGEIGECGR